MSLVDVSKDSYTVRVLQNITTTQSKVTAVIGLKSNLRGSIVSHALLNDFEKI